MNGQSQSSLLFSFNGSSKNAVMLQRSYGKTISVVKSTRYAVSYIIEPHKLEFCSKSIPRINFFLYFFLAVNWFE